MLDRVNVEERVVEYNTFGLDFATLIRALIEKILGVHTSGFYDALAYWWGIYSVIAIILAILFFIGFVYALIRYNQMLEIETQRIRDEEMAWAHTYGGTITKNDRWADIETHAGSENPNDWRQAIIEADIMLEATLDNAGYVGSTVSEKLKTAHPDSFRTLNDAWEAHKVRNQIAHEGTDFVLTKKTAHETLIRYERVFREFDVI